MSHIPDKNRNEWRNLLLGKIDVKINSFVFKMRLVSLKQQISDGDMSINEAIDEVYNLCVKYSKSDELSKDVKRIFAKTTTSDTKQTKGSETTIKDEIDTQNKIKEPKKKELVDDELKKMKYEIQILQQKIVTDKKVMQETIDEVVSQKNQVEEQLQKEKEVRNIILKNTKSTDHQTQNTIQEQKKDKALHLHTNRLITEKKITKTQKEVKQPKDEIKNRPQKQLKASASISREKKPFMKSLLDFLNE